MGPPVGQSFPGRAAVSTFETTVLVIAIVNALIAAANFVHALLDARRRLRQR